MKLRHTVRGFARSTTLRFNLQDPNAITSENLQKLFIAERRNTYALHFSAWEFSKVDFFNFQFVKLQALCVKNISPLLLAIFLLKAPAFQNLEILQLGTLSIVQDFPFLFESSTYRSQTLKSISNTIYCGILFRDLTSHPQGSSLPQSFGLQPKWLFPFPEIRRKTLFSNKRPRLETSFRHPREFQRHR